MFRKIAVWIASAIYRLPGSFPKKMIMVANVLFRNWKMDEIPTSACNNKFREYDLLRLLPDISDLDPQSQKNITNYVRIHALANLLPQTCFMLNCSKLSEMNDTVMTRDIYKQKKAFCRKYDLPMSLECSAAVFAHGLKLMPKYVSSYVADTVFIDAGAYIGDSALSLLEYQPRRIFSFEPSTVIFKALEKNWCRIPELHEKCVIYKSALGNTSEDISFVDTGNPDAHCENCDTVSACVKQQTLDSLAVQETRIGLIKADIEGMGLKMIQGAKETILRDKPVLTIAVYHCPDELFGIREELKKWGLQYEYHYLYLDPEHPCTELIMIAYPSNIKTDK